jgi:hypothetical protein
MDQVAEPRSDIADVVTPANIALAVSDEVVGGGSGHAASYLSKAGFGRKCGDQTSRGINPRPRVQAEEGGLARQI